MRHASQIHFGRPDRAVPITSNEGPDKWELLRNLTTAADNYELSYRTLGVLKALLTFLPTRDIPTGQGAVVFPSNKTLSDRLSGMPESTLRRHLSTLVRSGVVSRQDSPNRKRYARHVAKEITLAFGFDLTPLAKMDTLLKTAAQDAQARKERLAVMRDTVIRLRFDLICSKGQGALADTAARVLRRKPDEALLAAQIRALEEVLHADQPPSLATQEPSGSVSQNERHKQYGNKYNLDSEEFQMHCAPAQEKKLRKREGVSLASVIALCPSFRSYYPDRIRGWEDLIRIGDKIAPMLGIETPVIHEAKRAMGQQVLAVVVLCMLEKISSIRKPGAYLRHLSKLAKAQSFSIDPMLNALKLSADNGNYQFLSEV